MEEFLTAVLFKIITIRRLGRRGAASVCRSPDGLSIAQHLCADHIWSTHSSLTMAYLTEFYQCSHVSYGTLAWTEPRQDGVAFAHDSRTSSKSDILLHCGKLFKPRTSKDIGAISIRVVQRLPWKLPSLLFNAHPPISLRQLNVISIRAAPDDT